MTQKKMLNKLYRKIKDWKAYICVSVIAELIIVAVCIYVYIVYGVNRPERGNVCLYDEMMYFEYYGLELLLIIPVVIVTGLLLKSSHRCAVIVRFTDLRRYWNNICKNAAVICIYITSLLCINFWVSGMAVLYITDNFIICNWDMPDSRYKYVMGIAADRCPVPGEFAIYIYAEIFSVIFVSVMIMEVFYWISMNKAVGMMAAIVWICMDRYVYVTHILFAVITMMPGRVVKMYGITPVRCLVYPLAVCLIVYIMSLVIVRRRDILYKE